MTHHRAVDGLVRRWLANRQIEAIDREDLSARLRALQEIYRQHIAIEDGELFPAAGRVLSGDQIQAIGREMAARRRG
jgi:hemerythrin-like domain-containing protein